MYAEAPPTSAVAEDSRGGDMTGGRGGASDRMEENPKCLENHRELDWTTNEQHLAQERIEG